MATQWISACLCPSTSGHGAQGATRSAWTAANTPQHVGGPMGEGPPSARQRPHQVSRCEAAIEARQYRTVILIRILIFHSSSFLTTSPPFLFLSPPSLILPHTLSPLTLSPPSLPHTLFLFLPHTLPFLPSLPPSLPPSASNTVQGRGCKLRYGPRAGGEVVRGTVAR